MAEEPTSIPKTLKPLAPARFGYEEARHLLNRAGFGGDPSQIRTLADWGLDRAVDHLLDFAPIDYPRPTADRFDSEIMKPLSPAEQEEYRQARIRRDENVVARFRTRRQEAQGRDRRQIRAMRRWWLERMIESPRPLEEKMTLFWHGHFATSYRTIENSYHMFLQNCMFRSQAVGNFGELLFAVLRDPAMLAYLDNDQSRKGSPNENLARELMELFSLGEGAYTERDIKEGARALTGYTFEHNDFVFRRDWHDGGSKRILERQGNMDGDDFARVILEQKRCSEFIASGLHRFFVADPIAYPAPAAARGAIEDLASELRSARYDLKPALGRLFRSEHFYASPHRNGRIKSPVDLIVGAVRSLRTPGRDLDVLCDALALMGQDLFFPPSVAGWAGGRNWINTSTLFTRQNALTYLLTGRSPNARIAPNADRYDTAWLLETMHAAGVDPGADARRACALLLGIVIGPQPKGEDWASSPRCGSLVRFVEEHGGRISDDMLVGLLALITAAPEYQLC